MTNLYLSGLRKLATTNFYHHCFWPHIDICQNLLSSLL